MGETYHNSFDALIQKIRQDPVIYEHRDESGFKMPFDFSETEKPNDIDIFRKSKKWKTPKFSRALTEDQYFSEDENITVLLDFISRWYPNKVSTPAQLFENTDQVFFHGAHTHQFFEIMYLYSGELFINIQDDEYYLHAGHLWINNMQIKHSICLLGEDTNLINILVRQSTFEKHLMPLLRDNPDLLRFFTQSIYNTDETPRCLEFRVPEGSSLQNHLYDIVNEHVERDNYSQQIMLYSLSSLLLELSRQYSRTLRYGLNAPEGQLVIEKLLLYISDHFDTVTLESMSQDFNYSPEYISRTIAKETGKSFTKWRLNCRMERACDLLRTTTLSIEGIAQKVGYADRGSFESSFKKFFKLSPHQYRTLN